MKNNRKIPIIIVVTMLLSMLFATSSYAGVYTQDNVTVEVGSTVTIAVSSGDCYGHYYVNGTSGSCSAWDGGDGWLEPGENGYVTIKGDSLGSGTVEIGYYVTDEKYNDIESSISVGVNVVESIYDGGGEQLEEEEDTPLAVSIGDTKYKITADLSEVKLPEGFTKVDGTYLNEKVNVAKYVTADKNEEIILYALVPKEGGDVIFMTYDSSKKEFKEPKIIKQGNIIYYLLNVPNSLELPENFQIKDTSIGDISANSIVQKDSKSNDFVYLYALANGKEGYYSYDTKEGTIQRCTDLEDRISPNVEIVEIKNPVNKTMVIIIGVAILAVLAMGIILIVVLVKRKKEKNDKEEDDYYQAYNSYEYDDTPDEDETEKSDEIDELDVIDLSEDNEGLEEIKSIMSKDLEEDDGLDLIDLSKKTKDSEK